MHTTKAACFESAHMCDKQEMHIPLNLWLIDTIYEQMDLTLLRIKGHTGVQVIYILLYSDYALLYI